MNEALLKTVGEQLIHLRMQVGNQFMKPIKEVEKNHNSLSPGHVHTMSWIKSTENGSVSMKELSAITCVSKPNLTSLIDRLCEEGYVRRFNDENDRRVVNVALTREGYQYLEGHKARVMEFIHSRLALLEEPELNRLQGALKEMSELVDIIGERQENGATCE